MSLKFSIQGYPEYSGQIGLISRGLKCLDCEESKSDPDFSICHSAPYFARQNGFNIFHVLDVPRPHEFKSAGYDIQE
jgi:hypothetical protein